MKLPIELHLASDLQKSAMPPGFADLRLERRHHAGVASDRASPRRTGRWKTWSLPGASTIPRESAIRRRSRVSARPPAKADRLADAERTRFCKPRPWTFPKTAARRSNFWASTRPTDSAAAKCASIPPIRFPPTIAFPFAVERTDPRKVLFVDDGRRPQCAAVFPRRARCLGRRRVPDRNRCVPEQAANAQLSHYAFVVLSNLGSLPPGFEDSLKRYVSAGGSVLIALGPASAAHAERAGARRTHRSLELRRPRRRSVPHGFRNRRRPSRAAQRRALRGREVLSGDPRDAPRNRACWRG